MMSIFEKFKVEDLVSLDGRNIQIDLLSVLNMSPDAPLIKYLRKMANKSSNMKFMAITPTDIEKPQIQT